MIGAGASGYLVKGASDDEVIETVLRSARGETNPATETSAAVILDVAEEIRQEETESRRRRERISGVLESGAIAMAFQPVADLRDGRIIGAEALARFPGEPGRPIPRWFADAAAAGLLGELEIACVRTALAQLDCLPAGVFMGVNISPETVLSARFAETIAPFAGHDVVIEITEHAQVEDYDALRRAIAQGRRAGVKLAVDDVGAGFASLRHILRLEPDIIKLDVELVRDIDSDRARRALAKSLITFGQETDATIVAEGIESYQELWVLQDLGVTLGQGYYLARPAPLPLEAAPIAALRAG
jgi:EAL domain-containing protein (putative c-di-GMP-specific phosphodiesterase class I)